MPPERPPKVFISYSHDSDEHEDRVLDLAERLVENDGIDVALDRFANPPPASWPKWMEAEMKSSDFILVVCSAGYLAKIQSKVKRGTGKGIKWESLLSYQQIYDNDSDSSRFIPVLLEGGKYEHIPDPMRGGNHYRPEEDSEYLKLLRHITGQWETPKPVLGQLRKLPPKQKSAGKKRIAKSKLDSSSSRPWNVPHQRNEAFTGREEILTDLRADLKKKGKQALFGLGGVGKTQIAVEYAYRHREEYTAVLWTFADSEQSLRGGFSAIAKVLDLPEKDSTEQAKVTEAVKSWLEQNQGWLLVLDNADDPALLKPILPQQGKGHVLLTSRAHAFQAVGILSPREINVLSKNEAREFLLRRTGKDVNTKSPGADALAKELGYLPLALEQAGAYIVENGPSFENYLAGFKKQRLKLVEKQGPILGNDAKEQQKRTVTTTWSLNFADIEKHSPASADLLRLSAFLAPDAIPWELLENGRGQLNKPLADKLVEAVENPLALDELLSPLLRFSLIRRDDQAGTYSIHPLVQEVIRAEMHDRSQNAWSQITASVIAVAFPDPQEFRNWPNCDRLMPHALICSGFIDLHALKIRLAGHLSSKVGYYLNERGQYAEAELHYRRALDIDSKVLGSEHPEVATDLNNLAGLYQSQGRLLEAEPLLRRALTIREKAFGAESPETAGSLNNLAVFLSAQKKATEAEPLLRRALIIHEKTLGPEHPDFAISLHNLASLLENQEKPDETESMYRRALAICEKALGPEHPDIANILRSLARLLNVQGKSAEAEPLYRRALAIDERGLGPEHPDTAIGLNNLASFLAGQGKANEAEPLYRRALIIKEKVLGLGHPSTLLTRNNLILFYRKQGRNAEADALEKSAPKSGS